MFNSTHGVGTLQYKMDIDVRLKHQHPGVFGVNKLLKYGGIGWEHGLRHPVIFTMRYYITLPWYYFHEKLHVLGDNKGASGEKIIVWEFSIANQLQLIIANNSVIPFRKAIRFLICDWWNHLFLWGRREIMLVSSFKAWGTGCHDWKENKNYGGERTSK